jgi:hypothetical protein
MISVFVSRATPFNEMQRYFLVELKKYLKSRGLEPHTIGDTDYGKVPMEHIRGVMMDCNGLLGIGLRRFHVIRGVDRPKAVASDLLHVIGTVKDQWTTSPYVHLETAIAYHVGLPMLMLVETGVMMEGALESGVMFMYPPSIDLTSRETIDEFLSSEQWRQLVNTWEGEVREVVANKGRPPRLYQR